MATFSGNFAMAFGIFLRRSVANPIMRLCCGLVVSGSGLTRKHRRVDQRLVALPMLTAQALPISVTPLQRDLRLSTRFGRFFEG